MSLSINSELLPGSLSFPRNAADLNLLVGQLTGKQKASPCIKHALEVQRAMSTNNYHAFFEYYTNAPNMGAYIMDHFVDRERTKALMVMTKACVLFASSCSPVWRSESGFLVF